MVLERQAIITLEQDGEVEWRMLGYKGSVCVCVGNGGRQVE